VLSKNLYGDDFSDTHAETPTQDETFVIFAVLFASLRPERS